MLEPIFNDLSAETLGVDVYGAHAVMTEFVEVLRAAPERGLDPGLRIPQHFHELPLGPEFRIRDWLYDTRVPRDQARFLLTLATRSPYLDQTPEEIQERALLVDLRAGGNESDALRAAYLLQAPLVSLRQTPWDVPLIDCDCQELIDDVLTPQHAIQLPNVAQVSHFAIHEGWIRWRKQRSVTSGNDLWERRGSLFPHLSFCPSVEGQVNGIRPNAPRFQQAVDKIFDLEAYFAGWTSGAFDPDAFPKCNLVSPATLARYPADYRFSTVEGNEVIASWHLYLTPGKGRLYFEADGASRKGIVCHVGDKLPDTTYGRT